MICKKCKNKQGFVFGVCNECGFNNLTEQFDWIKVQVDDLPERIQPLLIKRYEKDIPQFIAKHK